MFSLLIAVYLIQSDSHKSTQKLFLFSCLLPKNYSLIMIFYARIESDVTYIFAELSIQDNKINYFLFLLCPLLKI